MDGFDLQDKDANQVKELAANIMEGGREAFTRSARNTVFRSSELPPTGSHIQPCFG
jgi:hypothetical protein